MSVFTRNLTFHSNNLGHNATLLLTFNDESMDGIYEDVFPTAWRVSTFAAQGPYALTATYRSQLAFIKPQIANNIIVSASTWKDINLGQSTNLMESEGVFSFSTPGPGSARFVQAWNKTTLRQDIALGFNNDPNTQPTPVLYFPNVGVGYNVTAEFTPILRAYIFTDYQQNQILRGAIHTPVLWKANLASLGPNSSFTLTYDVGSATYTITQDFAAFDITGQLGAIAALGSTDLEQIVNLLEKLNEDTRKAKKAIQSSSEDEGTSTRAIENVKA